MPQLRFESLSWIYVKKQLWGECIYSRQRQMLQLCLLCILSPHIFRNHFCTLGCLSNLSCVHISLCAPVLVPQMLGTGEPPDTMNRSSLHLLSVPSGCANTKLAKSSLRIKWNVCVKDGILFYRNWQTPSFNLLTVSRQELTLKYRTIIREFQLLTFYWFYSLYVEEYPGFWKYVPFTLVVPPHVELTAWNRITIWHWLTNSVVTNTKYIRTLKLKLK